MPATIPYNIYVTLCTPMTEATFSGGVPMEVQANLATAVVNVHWPDEAGQSNRATLVSTKVPIINVPHASTSVYGHLTMVYDYIAEINTVIIHGNLTHISTVLDNDTSRVWSNGEVSLDYGNWGWSLNRVQQIADMLAYQVAVCQNDVVEGMRASPAAYNVIVM
ncbi:hypothetical protein HPC49_17275 [Pyxidicoccus fallax]|uniref:Uncharacterized protein n=1 Tax=Pyxidicoccus fallax TaxID=394095 RepID=A0A848L8A4_9BACT|nr:hypothetical protein [Pyxidicoccus fallax]NMO14797.1 hypothetical protein [Pyxidicoccus fallax]NPC79965.1 hypothetical protein [Pyxidicoccus fallax]